MKNDEVSVPPNGTVSLAGGSVAPSNADRVRHLATRDPHVIRAWATRHGAEPATGEATASGPATIDVHDGSAGIRFNFPAMGRFRRITWDEWFAHLEQHRLVFVYEEEVADRAYALWQERGAEHAGDREDWFNAERQLGHAGPASSARYWFLQRQSSTSE